MMKVQPLTEQNVALSRMHECQVDGVLALLRAGATKVRVKPDRGGTFIARSAAAVHRCLARRQKHDPPPS